MLLGGVLGWSLFASVSGAVIASGVVSVESGNQNVEHIDGGTVNEILVRDGDQVDRGQVLLRFADGLLRSEEAILLAQYAELVARRNRLEAEFQGAEKITWNEELATMAEDDPSVVEILDGQERLFHAKAAARSGEIAQLRERVGQSLDEITGLEAQAESIREQGKLIARELEAQQSLFDDGLSPLSRLLALQRTAKSLDGQAGAITSRIARVRGGIAELEVQMLQIDARRIEEAEERAREVSANENHVKERLGSIRRRLARMEVRAPVAGEVFGMTVFAQSEVVRPGETILKIVPRDADLVVMARIQPSDVDQVYRGQPVRLRFSAFPDREAPEFDGHVGRLSADAVLDEKTGLHWYEVEVNAGYRAKDGAEKGGATDRQVLSRRIGDLDIAPGMPVEVYIQTGERTVIDYLIKPVTDFFYRSLREE